jgi:hypothetical protein
VKAPLLRFSSASEASTKTALVAALVAAQFTSLPLITAQVETKYIALPGVPAYYISLQFSTVQDFNFSVNTTSPKSNFTLPACTVYNGVIYTDCKGCNISSYTNYNVTYSCFDISQLCPSSVSIRRHLDEESSTISSLSRSLQTADAQSSDTTYGVLLASLAAQLSSVLSSNPFNLDLSKAAAILSFIGCLGGWILLSLIYLLRLDAHEKNIKRYVRREKYTAARKLLEEDIRNGGKGDLGEVYQRHLKKIKKDKDYDPSFDTSNDKRQSGLGGVKRRSIESRKSIDSKEKALRTSGYTTSCMKENKDSREIEERKLHSNMALVMQFLYEVFPGNSIFPKSKGNSFRVIFAMHDYTRYLSSSPMVKTRTIRFLELVIILLVGLFIDTLFFGVFYPSDDTCPILITEATCLIAPSKVQAGETLCLWDPVEKLCSLAPPPEDPQFVIIVALMCVLIDIPLMLMLRYVLQAYGEKYPGGRGYEESIEDSIMGTMMTTNNQMKEAQANGEQIGQIEMIPSMNQNFREVIKSGFNTKSSPKSSGIVKSTYGDFSSPCEEATMLIDAGRAYCAKGDMEAIHLPWEEMNQTDYNAKSKRATVDAIARDLGIDSNGNTVPLTIRQRLFFGGYHPKLAFKLKKSRTKANYIVEKLSNFMAWEEEARDMQLMRMFIFECLSPFKRFVYELYTSDYDEISGDKIGWVTYIVAWIFLSGALCFFMYWIFAWGVYNGGETLAAWGVNFGIGAAQDIMLVQLTKIFIVDVLTMNSMQAQLRMIRKMFADLSMSYINRSQTGVRYDEEEEIRVVQHMSAACRASRSKELKGLSSAWLLRQLDDIDAEKCREGRFQYLGTLSFLVIALVITCLLIDGDFGDAFIEAAIPSFFSSILLLGSELYGVSLSALLVPIAFLSAIGYYLYYVYRPARLNMAKRSPDIKGVRYTRKRRHLAIESTSTRRLIKKGQEISVYGYGTIKLIGHKLADYVVFFSWYRLEVQRARENGVKNRWISMNKPLTSQGIHESSNIPNPNVNPNFNPNVNPNANPNANPNTKAKPSFDSSLSLKHPDSNPNSSSDSSTNPHRRDSAVELPACISEMKISKRDWRHGTNDTKNKEFKEILNSDDNHELIISSPANARKINSVDARVIYEPLQAVRRIRYHLSGCSLQGLEEVDLTCKVLLRDLLWEFKSVWEVFHPDGIELSETEREEVEELFHSWSNEGKIEPFFSSLSGKRNSLRERDRETVTLQLFEEWFLGSLIETIHDVVRSRLFDKVLSITLSQNQCRDGDHSPSQPRQYMAFRNKSLKDNNYSKGSYKGSSEVLYKGPNSPNLNKEGTFKTFKGYNPSRETSVRALVGERYLQSALIRNHNSNSDPNHLFNPADIPNSYRQP